VRVEARVEEGDADAAPREVLVRAEPQPGRQDVSALLEDGGVLFELRARPPEQLDAAVADGLDALGRVGRD
jgi:CO/xanthine dehydrogenase Mo-binding subunit